MRAILELVSSTSAAMAPVNTGKVQVQEPLVLVLKHAVQKLLHQDGCNSTVFKQGSYGAITEETGIILHFS